MTIDPFDIDGAERAQRDREEKQRLISRQEVEDIKWVMSDKRGRRMMWGLLERAGLYRSSFTGNSETFFREGARNIGLMYWELIQTHCSEKCGAMITEHVEDERKRTTNGRHKQH